MIQTLLLDALTLGSGTDFPIREVSGLEVIPIRHPVLELPGQHGSYVPNQLYGGRRIIVAGHVRGATNAAYLANRKSLEAALKISRDVNLKLVPIVAKFNLVGGDAYQADVVPVRTTEMGFRPGHVTFEEFVFELEAADPALYSQLLTQSTISLPTGGGTALPTALPASLAAGTGGQAVLTNAGNLETFPVIRFNGPLTNPTIFSETLGLTLQLTIALLAGDFIEVDCKQKTVTQGGSTNKMNTLATGSEFWWLKPGENTVKFSALSGSGTAKVSFRSAWLGV